MDRKSKRPAIVYFAFFTVITTFVWIGFDVYRTLTKEPSPSVPDDIIAELDPNLDTESLAKITQGVFLEDSEIQDTILVDVDTFQQGINNSEEEAVEVPPEEEAVIEEELNQEELPIEATDEGTVAQ